VNLAIAATTLALIVPAELPDKTFISCVVMSSRYRALPVWIGAASGLIVQAAIAVVAGRLLDLLPHRAVEGVVAALFLGGAAYLIFVPEKAEFTRGEQIAERENGGSSADGAGGDVTVAGSGAGGMALAMPSAWRMGLSTFGIIVLAEFGDITQVLLANLSARYHDPLSVFVGAAVGFSLVSLAGVLGGKLLTRYVPLSLVRRLSGVALLGFGIYSIVGLITG
jgi:putative Ca2+/H+ antiporter (TMEM165/GDT1 family)